MKNTKTAILFDLDDTLYNLMDSFRKTHEELFPDFTAASCQELFQASRKYNKIAFDLWCQGKISKKEEFDYRVYQTYKDYGKLLSPEELEIYHKKYRNYQNNITLMSGMEEILDLLQKEGLTLGLLTNGNSADQQKKIDALHLYKWIPKENIFISQALPCPKPGLEAFKYVEQAMGLQKENTYYVGDTFEIDIVGAHKAGWHTIWFNHRKRQSSSLETPPDFEVRSPQELMGCLAPWCQTPLPKKRRDSHVEADSIENVIS